MNQRVLKCGNIASPHFQKTVSPDDGCGHHERHTNACFFTCGVICRADGDEECAHCGWNPKVANRRNRKWSTKET